MPTIATTDVDVQGGAVASGQRQGRIISETFAVAAAAVARADDLDDALAEMLGLAAEISGARAGALYILDADADRLELAVSFGVKGDVPEEVAAIASVGEGEGPLSVAIRSRMPLPTDDADRVAILRGSKSAYLLPLVVRRDGVEVCLGTIALGFAGDMPDEATLAGAEPLADLAAVAVERSLTLTLESERAEWYDRLAHTDPLTGLANRRVLDRMLELEVARAGRQGVPMSVALFEVDGLDEIQRAGGTSAADAVLRRVAQVLAGSVRLVDSIARYEPNRFALLAPGPDGQKVVERLVKAIAALPEAEGRPVSVSAGIATFPLDGRTPEELLAAGEAATQAAREAGGGRVVAKPAAAK
jgi:diguanylate cyclase (GGDEF)-like protein